jgi:hypothetical protein
MKERPPVVFGRKVPADTSKAIPASTQETAVNSSREPNTMTTAKIISLYDTIGKKDPGSVDRGA